ncbi:hypothetical protein KUCAC02_028243, partial [Chaenocephalus aceratus]
GRGSGRRLTTMALNVYQGTPGGLLTLPIFLIGLGGLPRKSKSLIMAFSTTPPISAYSPNVLPWLASSPGSAFLTDRERLTSS